MLAKKVPIDEEDMVDYLIDGIPSDYLQDLARMKEFSTKEDMLRAFEKVSLKLNARNNTKRDPRVAVRHDAKPADSFKDSQERPNCKANVNHSSRA
ncbi:hypothetical protein X777_06942 [Ooceraea biroi]|uniref:Uncharacterized protein n=1 Tax=Ooceraea biroi TaxID=2015173 RepID=A0A026WD49_OOCBI|nr:hypothetical protein X777_06942 [Ooceraea biroi]